MKTEDEKGVEDENTIFVFFKFISFFQQQKNLLWVNQFFFKLRLQNKHKNIYGF